MSYPVQQCVGETPRLFNNVNEIMYLLAPERGQASYYVTQTDRQKEKLWSSYSRILLTNFKGAAM